jgi:predicted heme/steroid binding protein
VAVGNPHHTTDGTPRQQNLTESELEVFDGRHPDVNGKVYVAVAGIVFDVEAGRAFYAEGGPYQPRKMGGATDSTDSVLFCKQGARFPIQTRITQSALWGVHGHIKSQGVLRRDFRDSKPYPAA